MEKRYIENLLNKLNKDYNFNLKYSNNFRMAFSHSSYTNEKRIAKHLNYERLEFLGDAVVELTTSEFLFKKFPNLAEGESFTGAMYLEAGLETVKTFLSNTLFTEVDSFEYLSFVDYKTILQEYVSKIKLGVIEYTVLDSSGPSHLKTFTSAVIIDGKQYGSGTAKTKKESEQLSAKAALEKLDYKEI